MKNSCTSKTSREKRSASGSIRRSCYAIATLLAVFAVAGIGLLLVTGTDSAKTIINRIPQSADQSRTKVSQVDSAAEGVTASDADIERIAKELDEEIDEIDRILADIDRVEVEEDVDIAKIDL